MITSRKTLDRKLMVAAAAFLLLAGGTGVAIAQQGGGTPMGGMDHGGMGHGMAGMDRGGSGSEGTDHGGMGHGMGGMGHGGGMMMGHGMGGMDHGAMGHGGGGMMMGHMMCRSAEHIEGRLAYLKAELKLTEAQTPQWNAFADAFRASAQKTAQYCAALREQTEKGGPSGVLAQLGLMERNMTAHIEEVRAIKAAAEPLFAALNEEQKKTADETMKGLMGLGMGMGRM